MSKKHVRDRNRDAGIATETGDAHGEIEQNMRDRLDDLRTLVRAAEGAEDLSYGEISALSALGVGESPPEGEEACDLSAEAGERLDEYPLCVERTTTFEIVIGTGGPDDRILIECDVVDARVIERGENVLASVGYEIRRVLYRYSWTGSAERELTGEDKAAAEAFARRVVPELAEC